MTLAAGSKLGPYEILGQIGAGGMGEVYRAKDSRLGREVAIKVLPASVSSDADRLRRFEQEARSASALNHPNIVAIYDIGSQDGTL
ncbi:MAG TPA: protein kinase, partial [Thermoanaerobaculia bacterium]|nr:protein kinase [Thermoanaerobaculia bacterium]